MNMISFAQFDNSHQFANENSDSNEKEDANREFSALLSSFYVPPPISFTPPPLAAPPPPVSKGAAAAGDLPNFPSLNGQIDFAAPNLSAANNLFARTPSAQTAPPEKSPIENTQSGEINQPDFPPSDNFWSGKILPVNPKTDLNTRLPLFKKMTQTSSLIGSEKTVAPNLPTDSLAAQFSSDKSVLPKTLKTENTPAVKPSASIFLATDGLKPVKASPQVQQSGNLFAQLPSDHPILVEQAPTESVHSVKNFGENLHPSDGFWSGKTVPVNTRTGKAEQVTDQVAEQNTDQVSAQPPLFKKSPDANLQPAIGHDLFAVHRAETNEEPPANPQIKDQTAEIPAEETILPEKLQSEKILPATKTPNEDFPSSDNFWSGKILPVNPHTDLDNRLPLFFKKLPETSGVANHEKTVAPHLLATDNLAIGKSISLNPPTDVPAIAPPQILSDKTASSEPLQIENTQSAETAGPEFHSTDDLFAARKLFSANPQTDNLFAKIPSDNSILPKQAPIENAYFVQTNIDNSSANNSFWSGKTVPVNTRTGKAEQVTDQVAEQNTDQVSVQPPLLKKSPEIIPEKPVEQRDVPENPATADESFARTENAKNLAPHSSISDNNSTSVSTAFFANQSANTAASLRAETKNQARPTLGLPKGLSKIFQSLAETPVEKPVALDFSGQNLSLAENADSSESDGIKPSDKKTSFEDLINEKTAPSAAQNLQVEKSPAKSPDIKAEQPVPAAQITEAISEMSSKITQLREPQIIKLRLRPAELGAVEIRLEQNANGKLNAHLTTQLESTKQILTDNISDLRQSLQQAGCQVERVEVSCESFSAATQSGSHNQSQQTPTEQERAAAFARNSSSSSETEASSSAGSLAEQHSKNRLLSVRA